jgi:hypothetical protein
MMTLVFVDHLRMTDELRHDLATIPFTSLRLVGCRIHDESFEELIRLLPTTVIEVFIRSISLIKKKRRKVLMDLLRRPTIQSVTLIKSELHKDLLETIGDNPSIVHLMITETWNYRLTSMSQAYQRLLSPSVVPKWRSFISCHHSSFMNSVLKPYHWQRLLEDAPDLGLLGLDLSSHHTVPEGLLKALAQSKVKDIKLHGSVPTEIFPAIADMKHLEHITMDHHALTLESGKTLLLGCQRLRDLKIMNGNYVPHGIIRELIPCIRWPLEAFGPPCSEPGHEHTSSYTSAELVFDRIHSLGANRMVALLDEPPVPKDILRHIYSFIS